MYLDHIVSEEVGSTKLQDIVAEWRFLLAGHTTCVFGDRKGIWFVKTCASKPLVRQLL